MATKTHALCCSAANSQTLQDRCDSTCYKNALLITLAVLPLIALAVGFAGHHYLGLTAAYRDFLWMGAAALAILSHAISTLTAQREKEVEPILYGDTPSDIDDGELENEASSTDSEKETTPDSAEGEHKAHVDAPLQSGASPSHPNANSHIDLPEPSPEGGELPIDPRRLSTITEHSEHSNLTDTPAADISVISTEGSSQAGDHSRPSRGSSRSRTNSASTASARALSARGSSQTGDHSRPSRGSSRSRTNSASTASARALSARGSSQAATSPGPSPESAQPVADTPAGAASPASPVPPTPITVSRTLFETPVAQPASALASDPDLNLSGADLQSVVVQLQAMVSPQRAAPLEVRPDTPVDAPPNQRASSERDSIWKPRFGHSDDLFWT